MPSACADLQLLRTLSWEGKVTMQAGTKITCAALFACHLAMSQSAASLQLGVQLAMDSGGLLIASMAFACQVVLFFENSLTPCISWRLCMPCEWEESID
jgi:hypothetical protein